MHSIRTATIVAVVAVVAVATGCTSGAVSSPAPASNSAATMAAQSDAVPTPTPAATAAPSAAGPTSAPTTPLEGTWSTGPVPCDQQLATIHKAGITDAQIVATGWVCYQSYRIRFRGDHLAEFEQSPDGVFNPGAQWTAVQVTDGHTVVATGDDGQTLDTMSFALVGTVLTFEAVKTPDPGGQIALTAILLSAPYTREP